MCVNSFTVFRAISFFSKKKKISYVFSKVEIDILTILNDKWIQSSNCIRSFLNQKKKLYSELSFNWTPSKKP